MRNGLSDLTRELADLKTQADAMQAQWESEKAAIGKVARHSGEDRAHQAPDRGCRTPVTTWTWPPSSSTAGCRSWRDSCRKRKNG